MTKKGFSKLAGMFEGALGIKFDRAQKQVWMLALRDFEDSIALEAGLRLVQEWRPRFFGDRPYPVDLIERMRGRSDEDAELAWQRVLRSIMSGPESYDPINGTRPTGEDLDEVTLEAVGGKRGLWRLAALIDDEERLHWARRDFIESYKAIQRYGRALPAGNQEVSGFLKRVEDVIEGVEADEGDEADKDTVEVMKRLLPQVSETTLRDAVNVMREKGFSEEETRRYIGRVLIEEQERIEATRRAVKQETLL